jgi:hypothetical protein
MATNIRLKSSSQSGKEPTLSELSLRELAVNTADGKIFLRKGDGSGTDKIIDVTAPLQANEPMGHEDKSQSTISFNSGTRVFTIQPSSTSFNVWCKGVKYKYTSAQTVTIPSGTTGLYYIYFDSSGVLQYRTSYFDWENDTPTAYVYWNDTTGTAPFVADERHGIVLDWQTHEYLHRTRGASIANGFSISNYTTTGTGANNADAQFDLSGGAFFDEDLEVAITHSNTPTANTWEQDLQGPANIPVFYQSGNSWVVDSPTDYALKQGTSRIKYNLLSGGTWSTPDVSTNSWYTTSWVIATNNINYPIIVIMGQSASAQISDQEELTFGDLTLGGFPIVEFRPLWKIIWVTDSTYANTPKAKISAVFDIRQLTSTGGISGTTPVSDHGLLSGLGDDDHLQYVHVSENRTITANHTITGNLGLSGGLKDRLGNLGSAGQFLSSTGTNIEWKYPTVTNVLYVSKDGNDSNSGTSLQNAKATIKSALSVASAGTVIKISAGNYIENNPVSIPAQVSIVGDSLREVSISPQNSGNLFYINNGSYVSNMSFTSTTSNSGAIFSFNPSDPPYINQSPYIQNCTNFISGSTGLLIDGDNCIGQLKSMVVDSYTQFNQNGIGAQIKNDGYAQLVSMFTICTDKAIECKNGGGCDLTNSNSSFGNYGLISDGVSDLKYTGTVTSAVSAESSNIINVDISTTTYNVTDASYTNSTGEVTITIGSHSIQAGMEVEIQNLTFSCSSGGSPSNQVFPSGNYGYIFTVKSVTSTTITANVGSSTLSHTYVSGGTVKINNIKPYDGQVITFNNTLYYQVEKITVTNGGSNYTSVPTITISSPSPSWGITAQAIAEIENGQIKSIQIVSSGRGYTSSLPTLTFTGGGGSGVTYSVQMKPQYYVILNAEESSSNNYKITLDAELPFDLTNTDSVQFYKQTRLLASGHSFEYIGSGTNIQNCLPFKGGVGIQENEIDMRNGGLVVYTSTDQSGNFRIGDGVIINQLTGTITGDFYSKSLFSSITPFILALGA